MLSETKSSEKNISASGASGASGSSSQFLLDPLHKNKHKHRETEHLLYPAGQRIMSMSENPDIPVAVNEKGEANFNELLKQEFAKLHKQYRALESKRHGIAQHEGYMRVRTKRILPIMVHSRQNLNHELVNAQSKLHQEQVNVITATIKEALNTYDQYQAEITKRLKQIRETEKMVDKITDKVLKQRMKLLTLHGMSKTMECRELEMSKAEDKLYHYTCTFNTQISENKTLRDDIQDLLQERKEFFKIHNHIKRQIAHTKKRMLHVVQLAIRTYDNRDEAMIKIRAIREKEEKEGRQHGMDLQEFERTLHHDERMLSFIKIKSNERPAYEDAKERKARLAAAREQELDTILRKYKLSFRRILSYSETSSIEGLLEKYQTLDGDNFEYFMYLTNLNSECEVMRGTIDVLKTEIEHADAVVESGKRRQRKQQRQLQLSIIDQHEMLDSYEAQKTRNDIKLETVFGAIGSAFVLAECNKDPIMRLLGHTTGVSEHNVRLCLFLLDLKITEIKQERDHLRDVHASGTITNLLKPAPISKSRAQANFGGPFIPKVTIFHVEALEEDDPKILEKEPYYYDQMREYMYDKMVEEKIINPEGRVVTTPAKKKTVRKSGEKSLLETSKSRQSEVGVILNRGKGKKTKKLSKHSKSSQPGLATVAGGVDNTSTLASMLEKYPPQNIFKNGSPITTPPSKSRVSRVSKTVNQSASFRQSKVVFKETSGSQHPSPTGEDTSAMSGSHHPSPTGGDTSATSRSHHPSPTGGDMSAVTSPTGHEDSEKER